MRKFLTLAGCVAMLFVPSLAQAQGVVAPPSLLRSLEQVRTRTVSITCGCGHQFDLYAGESDAQVRHRCLVHLCKEEGWASACQTLGIAPSKRDGPPRFAAWVVGTAAVGAVVAVGISPLLETENEQGETPKSKTQTVIQGALLGAGAGFVLGGLSLLEISITPRWIGGRIRW